MSIYFLFYCTGGLGQNGNKYIFFFELFDIKIIITLIKLEQTRKPTATKYK